MNRDPIKWIRDAAKSRYPTKVQCAICNTKADLQLHHYNTLTLLLAVWLKGNKITTDEQILEVRDDFIKEHESELFEQVVCLCKNCHNNKLHKVYGKTPSLATATKQPKWVEKMHLKFEAKA